jgi:uncharacterized protein
MSESTRSWEPDSHLISVTVWLDSRGRLEGLDASGHSGSAQAGEDLVCAAASALLRTLSRILEMEPSVELKGKAEEKGDIRLRILSDQSPPGWLEGVTDFISIGLKDLEEENPGYFRIRFEGPDSLKQKLRR